MWPLLLSVRLPLGVRVERQFDGLELIPTKVETFVDMHLIRSVEVE